MFRLIDRPDMTVDVYCGRKTPNTTAVYKGWSGGAMVLGKLRARVGRPKTSYRPPRRLFCFGSLLVSDVMFRYLSLCLLYINSKIGKNRCLMLD